MTLIDEAPVVCQLSVRGLPGIADWGEATNAFTVEDDFSSHSDSGEAFEDESDPYAAYGREAYGDYATDGPSQPDDTPPESDGSQPEPAEAPVVAEAGTPAEPTAQEPVKEA